MPRRIEVRFKDRVAQLLEKYYSSVVNRNHEIHITNDSGHEVSIQVIDIHYANIYWHEGINHWRPVVIPRDEPDPERYLLKEIVQFIRPDFRLGEFGMGLEHRMPPPVISRGYVKRDMLTKHNLSAPVPSRDYDPVERASFRS